MRQVSERGLALIRQFEGFSAKPYRCPAGYLTIGYGHVIRTGEDWSHGIDVVQADRLLKGDVLKAERAVNTLTPVPLTHGQFDALVSFTFNLGRGAFQRSTLRRKVNRGEHSEATQEFPRWIWAGGRRLPGLLRRRRAEARIYKGIDKQI